MIKTIDAHQHFWNYNPQKHSWINDEMQVLKKDFLPLELFDVLQANEVEKTIAVQADQSEEETDFLLQLADEFPFISGVVGWVDLRADNIESRLDHYHNFEKLIGFRHVVQGEPDPDFMLRPDFQRGIGLLNKYQFTYDILIFPHQMPAALKTIEAFPNQPFVIDHIAKPLIKDQLLEPWRTHMHKMAQHQNVYCKVSGMVTEAHWHNWQYEDLVPYLDVVFAAFGPDRIMYGSDWPVCLLAGEYSAVKGVLDQYVEKFSEYEKAKIWGGNAAQFYLS